MVGVPMCEEGVGDGCTFRFQDRLECEPPGGFTLACIDEETCTGSANEVGARSCDAIDFSSSY